MFAAVATIADWHSGQSGRLRADVELFAIALSASVVLLPIARYLARRDASGQSAPSAGGSLVAGAFTAGMGLLIIALGAYRVGAVVHRARLDDFMFIPAALIFVFGGMLLSPKPAQPRVRRLLGALLATAFAVTLDWIAFAPGERHFSGGVSLGFVGVSAPPGEWVGRTIFGMFAVIATIIAVGAWTRIGRSESG